MHGIMILAGSPQKFGQEDTGEPNNHSTSGPCVGHPWSFGFQSRISLIGNKDSCQQQNKCTSSPLSYTPAPIDCHLISLCPLIGIKLTMNGWSGCSHAVGVVVLVQSTHAVGSKCLWQEQEALATQWSLFDGCYCLWSYVLTLSH
jgi:hypothetical protein